MKGKKYKNAAILLVVLLLTVSVVTANASIQKIIAYTNSEIKITYNGSVTQFKDADGSALTPIFYEGHTYLPVKAVAEMTGMDVDYNDSTKTVIISGDASGAVPYKDSKDPANPTPKPAGSYTAPVVTAYAEGGKIIVKWNPISDSRLQGYKVVVSKNNPKPAYPNDGYMYWITDLDQSSATMDSEDAYNGGDFGGYLVPGQKYYISVTAVYNDRKIPGNVVQLEFKR